MAKNSYLKENEKLKKSITKQTKDMNYQLKKVLKMTLLTVGTVGLVKVYINNQELLTENNEKTNTPVQLEEVIQNHVAEDVVKIDINDLLRDYSRAATLDEVNSVNEEYEGLYMDITGEVNNIYIDSIDGNFVTLKGDEDWYGNVMTVQCNIENKDEIEQLKDLKRGKEIDVQGYCIGGEGISVQLNDCIIK